jgi:deazaflavin-dependent oxidoreductase (nitroreductase family)
MLLFVRSSSAPDKRAQHIPQEHTAMAKQFRYTFVFRAGNFVQRGLLALGISLNGTTLITVAGRKTGRPHSTPITMIELAGQRYIQSPFGNVNWVRNLRAAGKATLSWGRRHETVTVTELTPEQAAPVIKSLLGSAPKMIRDYFEVTPESSLQEFIRDAPNHAVFAVHPASSTPQREAVGLNVA